MPIKPLQSDASQSPAWRRPAPVAQPAPPERWSSARLLAAPHRLGFSAAASVLGGSALWWAIMLGLRTASVNVSWTVQPSLAHGLLFTWGFMPLFIVGFLFTAGPRWLQAPEVDAARLAPAVVVYLLGILTMVSGFHTHRWLSAAGLLVATLAWGALCLRYGRLWFIGRSDDKAHATFILAACCMGFVAMAITIAGLIANHDLWIRSALHIGLWCYIASVFASVSHRMIPFFTASALPILDAWRPQWLLWSLVGALWWVALGQLLELWAWPLPSTWYAVLALVEAVSAVLFLWLAIRWGLVQSLKIRLLAMLHGGFVWLGIGLALLSAHHAWLATWGESSPLGLAPLHALTMGYLGATLFAMATRVAAGHSGRSLVADNYAWTLYGIVQLAIVLRLWAALSWGPATALLLIAIALWALACSAWALRYVRWFGLPRQDGRPG